MHVSSQIIITNTQIYLNIYISKECDKAGVVDKSKLAIHGTALKATDQFDYSAVDQLISSTVQPYSN